MTKLAVVDNSEKKSGDDGSTETGNQKQRRHLRYLWKSIHHCSEWLMKLHCLHWSERRVRAVTIIVRSTLFWPFSTTKYRNLQYVVGNLTSSSNIMFLCWWYSQEGKLRPPDKPVEEEKPTSVTAIVSAVCLSLQFVLWWLFVLARSGAYWLSSRIFVPCLYVVPHAKTSV